LAELDQNIVTVIEAWNDKLKINSLDLSKFIPICELFCISKNDVFPKNVGDKEELNDSILVNINDGITTENTYITPLFSLLKTQTQNENNQLINKKGVAGINNCKISYLDANFGSLEVTLVLTIPDIKNELLKNPLFRKFIIVNRDYLLYYGWGRNNFSKSDFKEGDEIDLTTVNGYNKFLYITLQRMGMESGNNGETIITASFYSKSSINLLNYNTRIYNNEIKNLLSKNATSKDDKKYPIMNLIKENKFTGDLKQNAGIPLQRIISKKDGDAIKKNKENIENLQYYYLGWVFQTIRYIINENKEIGTINDIEFQNLLKPYTINLKVSEDKKTTVAKNIVNIAEIPILADEIDKILFLGTYSFKQFLVNILRHCAELTNSNLQIRIENKKMIVFDQNKKISETKEKEKRIEIHFGSENSLLESLSFGTSLDKDMFFSLNTFLNSNKGPSQIYNVAKDLSKTKDSYLGMIYKEFRDSFPDENMYQSYTFKNYFNSGNIDVSKAYAEILTSESSPAGLILRNYFNDMTFNIHGTVDISSFFEIHLKNYLEGIDGTYVVRNVTDDLTPKSFHTILECSMLSPDNMST